MYRLFHVLVALLLVAGCGDNKVGSDGTTDGQPPDGADGIDMLPDHISPDNGIDTLPPDLPDINYEPELCGEAEFNITRVIPDVLILLDRSNSMSFSPPTPPLWQTIRDAIISVTSALDHAIWFGLMSFPNSVPPNHCFGFDNQCTAPASTSVLVPVGPDAAPAIETTLLSLSTCGGTPIAMSLQSANEYLATLTDDHPKYIILATDGAPNCNEELDGNTCVCTGDNCWINNLNCLDDVRTYGVLDDLCSNGVGTYILGMGGATEWTDVLQGMATHGCTDTHYAAEDPEAIQQALDDIAGAVLSCRFELNCADIPDIGKVNFYFDGEVVPQDPSNTNGWNWVDPCESTSDESGIIEFFGEACDKIMGGEVETVSATFGCPTIII